MVKRARGGSDFDRDRLVALCRRCHARTDAPYARGRLVVMALGGGRFRFEVVWGANALAGAREPRVLDGGAEVAREEEGLPTWAKRLAEAIRWQRRPEGR